MEQRKYDSSPVGALREACRRAEAAVASLNTAGVGEDLSVEELEEMAAAVRRVKAGIAVFECSLTGRLTRLRGRAGAAGVLRDRLGMTGYQADRMTRLSEALEEMPNTRARLADGSITLAHLNTLARTARECGAREVDQDRDLLDRAARTPPDRFSRQARMWADRRAADRGEKLLETQRSRRRAFAFWSRRKQMGVLHAELDPIRFGQIRQALDLHNDALRRADSGRGVPPDEVRNNDQRRADALFELMTGRDAGALHPKPGMAGKPSTKLIITAEVGLIDGTDPDGACEIVDTGPVPPSVLEQLSPDTEISGALFDRKGNPLWLGRSRRLAAASQRLAAAVRDRGCVLCDAPTHLTQLHHIRDWGRGGRTDIDNLASVCGPDHRRLQKHGLRLVNTPGGWTTQPGDGPPAPALTGRPASRPP